MIRTIRVIWIVLPLGLLASCYSLRYGGAPQPSFDVDKDLEQLAKQFEQADAITGFYRNPSTEGRDKFISGRLVMMNIRYIQFIRQLTSEKQLFDSATEMLKLALSLAGTAVDSAATKTVLSAIVAGLTGSKATIEKNYYYEKTIPALIAAMNAERKKALVSILTGVRGSLDDYPFPQAVTDLHSYYHAGTFAGAIQAIQTDAAIKEQSKDQVIATLSPVTEEHVLTKESLTRAIGKLGPNDLEKAKTALRLIDPNFAPANTLDDVKLQLQSYVRGARTAARIGEVAKAFKDAGINL